MKILNVQPIPTIIILEILHDAGLLGFFALSIFSFAIIYTIYKNFRQKNLIYEDKLIISLLLLNLLIEIFPIKSTGSIFSTWTGTIFWLSIALVNYGSRKRLLIEINLH